MLKSEIKPRTEYGFREKRRTGIPLERVQIIEHIRGDKWKAEWIQPNPGLVHYVDSGQLVCTWREQKAFLKEEACAERLREYNIERGYDDQSPIASAVIEVFESVGEQGVDCYRGVLFGPPEAIDRIRARAGASTGASSPVGYIDRKGMLRLPFQEALKLARGFCSKEPSTLLVGIESREREWSMKASQPGEEYLIAVLNEARAAWALIRQWTGLDPAIAQREAQIERLERLEWDAVYALQKAGLDSEAARLRRSLDKH
jgi:hypothetical protein